MPSPFSCHCIPVFLVPSFPHWPSYLFLIYFFPLPFAQLPTEFSCRYCNDITATGLHFGSPNSYRRPRRTSRQHGQLVRISFVCEGRLATAENTMHRECENGHPLLSGARAAMDIGHEGAGAACPPSLPGRRHICTRMARPPL